MSSEAQVRFDTLEGALENVLEAFVPDADSSVSETAQKAAHLARLMQRRAVELQTPQEKKQQTELERMMQNAGDKVTMIQMTDQAFRSDDPHRAVDQLTHILDIQGVPRFFSRMDRTLLRGFQSFGGYLPGVAVPLVKGKMREETANVVLPAEREVLDAHLGARREQGLRMNVNFLGEALLGETEAQSRLESYLRALQNPLIECISVKISTIYSQISSLAFEHTVEVLCDRLELLYRAAAKSQFVRADGTEVPKFVYLDMEEYRDVSVTAEAFMRTLDRPGLDHVHAGIALQAYVPDSFPVQQCINDWARKRVAAGGSPVTVRLVKGANMEMERVEASIHDWPQAPYQRKIETDANFKRMVLEGIQPENIAAVRLAIASHNLFDIAYGLVLAVDGNCLESVQFEMLEGMANHQRRALFELSKSLLLYAPATYRENFIHAIGYLIRRLDENTGPDNFLRHTFRLVVDSDEWRSLEADFFASFDLIDGLPQEPRRTQDRRVPIAPLADPPKRDDATIDSFENEPDTDFALIANVEWADGIIASWKDRCDDKAVDVPIVIAGEELRDDRKIRESYDPSRPGVVVARYRQATEEDVRRAVEVARDDPSGWRSRPVEEHSAILARAAHELRIGRADLMGAALAEGGKTFPQSDPEVSEAIDFCEFYRRSACELHALKGVEAQPKGVVVVVPPWNFPIAIPCGGVAAGLAAGNHVILKPASDTVLVAWEMCQCFWRAGVPRDVLQFAPCSGASVGSKLASHPDVDVVILTGGTETALAMLDAAPQMNLLAETGGKNATIVTALSDREQAIKHVLQSAFGHSGQKCSATSLLILEAEIYDDPNFKRMLCDAARSIEVGSAWETRTLMGPMIRPPSGELETALKVLEPGESWAVMPHKLEDNPCLWSPAVKWDVSPGSVTHGTEFFGPVLGVMKARNLDEAISLVNATGFGLTSGLESLDDREQEEWLHRIRAGNLYVNRVTTGAIVLRQPFGGMGKSAFGPGIKAGGPNYVAQLLDFQPSGEIAVSDSIADEALAGLAVSLQADDDFLATRLDAAEIDAIITTIGSYDLAVREEFGREHDHFRLVGQDNLRRYLPVDELRIRLHADDTTFEVFARVCAARAAGGRITVSSPPDLPDRLRGVVEVIEVLTEPWGARIEFVEETDDELVDAIRSQRTERVRYAAPDRAPESVLQAPGDSGIYIARTPVLPIGRIELLWYLREQSVSDDYHRYGNLGGRTDEERASVM